MTYQGNKQLLFFREAGDDWRWTLQSINGNKMCNSGEGYENYGDMVSAAKSSLDLFSLPEERKVLQQDSFIVHRRSDQVEVILVAAPDADDENG